MPRTDSLRRRLLASAVFAAALCTLCGCSDAPEDKREVAKATARDEMGELRAYLKANLIDPAKARVALDAVDEIERGLDEVRRAKGAALADVRRVNARFDATRPELQAVADAFTAQRKAARTAMIAAHLRLREATPEPHWTQVYVLEERALQAKLAIAPKEPAPVSDKGGMK